jgi:uncharacterized membrane protein YeaQ/YmgE (transglycosylase-associated protein family)
MIGLIVSICIGILAGFLAGKIMRGQGYGILLDLLLGIGGSILGYFVFGLLQLTPTGLIGRIAVSTAGAVLLIYIARRLK